LKYDVTFGGDKTDIFLLSFVNAIMMGKLSNEDKECIQTLCEQEFGAKAITASYPDKKLEPEHVEDDLPSGQ